MRETWHVCYFWKPRYRRKRYQLSRVVLVHVNAQHACSFVRIRTCAAALHREEEKAVQVIKQAAKNGETRGCRNIAAAIARSRKMTRRLQTVKFRLDSVEINLQQQRCMFLPRNAMHKRGCSRHAVSVCLSVCPSVTLVDHVKTNKHIFEFFSPSGSHTILVFPYQTGWRYSDGNTP